MDAPVREPRTPRRAAWRQHLRPDLGLGREVGLIFWSFVALGAGFGMQTALWTLFIDDLGGTPQQIGLVIGVTSALRALLMLPAATLSDRYSPRVIGSSAVGVAVLGALALVGAEVWWHAVIGAVLIEVSALAMPALTAHITASTPLAHRTRAFAYTYNVSFSAPMIIFPAIGGWLATRSGFDAVFVCIAGLYLLSALLLLGLRPTPLDHDERPAALTVVDSTSTPGPDAVLPEAPDPSRATAAPSSRTYRELLSSGWVRFMLGYQIAVAGCLWLGFVMASNYLVDEHDYSLERIGSIASVASIAGLSWGLLAGHWKPLSNPLRAIAVTTMFAAVSAVLFLSTGWLPVVVVAWMLRSCFANVWAMMAAALSEVTPQRLQSRAFAASEIGIGVGDAAGPVTAGWLYGQDRQLPMLATLGTAPVLTSAVLLAMRRRRAEQRAALRGGADGAGDGSGTTLPEGGTAG